MILYVIMSRATMFFDVIFVGWAKEFDAPAKLMERPSLFAALVQEYSNRSSGL